MQTSKERSQNNMKKQTLGVMIASIRKERGMTQLELAEKMGVTDKAVSKWERDLSCPDVSSIPQLAEILGVSVDELMQVKDITKETSSQDNIKGIIDTAFKGVGLAMGIALPPPSCCAFIFESDRSEISDWNAGNWSGVP